MPAITLNSVVTVPQAGDTYTYQTTLSGPLFWRGGDVDVKLTVIEGAHRKEIATDNTAEGFYDLAAGENVEFEVTPDRAGGDAWFKVSV